MIIGDNDSMYNTGLLSGKTRVIHTIVFLFFCTKANPPSFVAVAHAGDSLTLRSYE
jgi:hypothetical protein